jgi:hypothetical protein
MQPIHRPLNPASSGSPTRPAAWARGLVFVALATTACGHDDAAEDQGTGTAEAASEAPATTTTTDEPTTGTPDPSGTTEPTTGDIPEPMPDLYKPVWQFGYYNDDTEVPQAVAFTASGDLHVLGGDEHTSIIKVSAAGEPQTGFEFFCGRDMADYAFTRGFLAIAANGDLVAAAHFDGACSIGGAPHDTTPDDRRFFVARFASDGNPLWSRSFGATNGDNWDTLGSFALDPAGDIVMSGTYTGSIDFGDGPLMATTAAATDVFLAKLSGADGGALWSRSIASTEDYYDESAGLAVAADGAVHALYWLNGALDIAGHHVDGDDGLFSTVLVGFDGAGNYIYHRAEPLDGFDASRPNSVAVADDGTLAVFHYLNTGGSITIDGTAHTASNSGSLLLLRYSAAGAPIDASTVSTDMNVYHELYAAKSVAALPSGELVIAGEYGDATKFGPYTLPTAPTDGFTPGLHTAVLTNTGASVWAYGVPMPANGFELADMAATSDRIALLGDYFTVDFGLGPLTSDGPSASTFLVLFERSP